MRKAVENWFLFKLLYFLISCFSPILDLTFSSLCLRLSSGTHTYHRPLPSITVFTSPSQHPSVVDSDSASIVFVVAFSGLLSLSRCCSILSCCGSDSKAGSGDAFLPLYLGVGVRGGEVRRKSAELVFPQCKVGTFERRHRFGEIVRRPAGELCCYALLSIYRSPLYLFTQPFVFSFFFHSRCPCELRARVSMLANSGLPRASR